MNLAESRARWKGVQLFGALNRRTRRWMVSTKLGTKKWRVVFGDSAESAALAWAAGLRWRGEIMVYVTNVASERHANGQPISVHAFTLVKAGTVNQEANDVGQGHSAAP